VVNALSVLFPSDEVVAPEALKAVKAMGFKDEIEATTVGIAGLWCLHRFAGMAAEYWERQPPEGRVPDPFLMGWSIAMAKAYVAIVVSKVPLPRRPHHDSPFIRFCDAIRLRVLKAIDASPTSFRVAAALRRDLISIECDVLAEFVRRNRQEIQGHISAGANGGRKRPSKHPDE
jgi:hypothetical protein